MNQAIRLDKGIRKMSMTDMTTEELMAQQATETMFIILTNSRELLFRVQSAYFLVARKFLGYNPNKSFSPFATSILEHADRGEQADKGRAVFGELTKSNADLMFRFVLSEPRFKAAVMKEMADCGMEPDEIRDVINNFSGRDIAQMFNEQYRDEMMRYAAMHKGNSPLPRDWQSLISRDRQPQI